MPKIIVDGKEVYAEKDKRLVLVIEDAGIDILHRCGGWAGCTTCRVRFVSGEPLKMTKAERDKLDSEGLLGLVRLSCQILCEHDMIVETVMRVSNTEYTNPGRRPEDRTQPWDQWFDF